jgi:hypothetical protein
MIHNGCSGANHKGGGGSGGSSPRGNRAYYYGCRGANHQRGRGIPGVDPARPRAADRRGGFGLTAMRQRVEGLAGTLEIESEPGGGTAISASVPTGPAVIAASNSGPTRATLRRPERAAVPSWTGS